MEQKENNIEDKRLIAIGKLIKQLRIEMGYSSAEIFAYEKNINRISYWRMEKGSNITLNSLLKILDIHQISLSEFFNRVEI
ncbi:MAG: helix-turn-helix transcriptional regulator [Paludibacteraceae bacterium]|nr:helix-turn-helix transcriptional regulator [Paludibacteraceae bacterium]MBR2492523.1 helix-turn-helix transcriptional regulator [Paludibacteraceae bacterium]MBR3872311.1 helix-turn-helix transcriptional regulator [Paludibacteraceae bacterium]